MESRVLSALLHDRQAYDDLVGILDYNDFTEQGKLIAQQIIDYYNNDNSAAKVDVDYLISAFDRLYPKHSSVFQTVVKRLQPVSVPNVVREYKEFQKQQTGQRLAHALLSGSQEIEQLMEKYSSIGNDSEEDENVFVAPELDSIVESVETKNLVRVLPKSLNDCLGGGVPRGTHIVMFARPETGKTMFSINMACGFLRDKLKVLYVGNEDPAPQMLMRFYSRMTGMTKQEIIRDKDKARSIAQDKGINNLVFASLAPGTLQEIEGLIRKHEPDVLMLDQMTNLSCKVDGEVEKALFLARKVRALIKKHNLVGVSICQAGDSASNKLVLDQGDVYYSNTAIPAQADVMIGIGCNADLDAAKRRMLSLPKNKITGVHDAFAVLVEPAYSKVVSL